MEGEEEIEIMEEEIMIGIMTEIMIVIGIETAIEIMMIKIRIEITIETEIETVIEIMEETDTVVAVIALLTIQNSVFLLQIYLKDVLGKI
jgi:hypothetical protein